MKLRELLRGVEISASTADLDMEIDSLCCDSRKAAPGALFAAIDGVAADGHRFIPAAAAAGAAAVLCQRAPEGAGVPWVLTPDSRRALALAARNWYGDPAGELTMVGVTGTNGKTTTTLLIKHVLEQTRGAKVGLIGTNGNRIGDVELPAERTTPGPLELQALLREMADAGCSHVVMEVSSHALDQERTAGIRFAAGVFTNLTQDHLDYHKTMENYARAKARLFSVCGAGAVNLDDPWGDYMLSQAQCPVSTFAVDREGANLVALDVKLLPDAVEFTAAGAGTSVPVRLGIPGRFSVYNALGVLCCCYLLGISPQETAAALATARGVRGRVETVPTDGDYTVLIDYAHTPDALDNVLRAVRETARGRVVAVFGCGGDRDRGKRPIMGRIATELADFSVITSDNPRTEAPEAIIGEILAGVTAPAERCTAITDRVEAIAWAIEHHRPGDVIVLAGKGHETYQEVNGVKHHMDEREIVAEILEKRKQKT